MSLKDNMQLGTLITGEVAEVIKYDKFKEAVLELKKILKSGEKLSGNEFRISRAEEYKGHLCAMDALEEIVKILGVFEK